MTELYELFDKCMSNNSTNAMYCSKMLNNIKPSINHTVRYFEDEQISYSFHNLKVNTYADSSYTNWMFCNNDVPFTNDDVKSYLNKLLKTLESNHYIQEYRLSYNNDYKSLVAVLKAQDSETKADLYDFFSEMPASINNRVLTYIS
jgi:hypothetical protein